MLTRIYLFHRFRFDSFFALACLWFIGLFAGTMTACLIRKDLFTLMGVAQLCNASIVCLIAFQFFPFLLSALAVSMGKSHLLFIVLVARAFLLSFYSCLLYRSFGSAGWLVQPLSQLSSLLSAPFLCWFSIRHISDRNHLIGKDLVICLIGVCLIAVVDYCIVSPFLEDLLRVWKGSLVHVGFDSRL